MTRVCDCVCFYVRYVQDIGVLVCVCHMCVYMCVTYNTLSLWAMSSITREYVS
jgi:hypothetical protein